MVDGRSLLIDLNEFNIYTSPVMERDCGLL